MKREPSKAELREMLAQAMRNTEAKKVAAFEPVTHVPALPPPPVAPALPAAQVGRDWLHVTEEERNVKVERKPFVRMPEDEAAELRRLCEEYNFVVHPTTDPWSLLKSLRGFEREREIFAEYAWRIGERVIVESDWWGGFFICGDGAWDRPDPTIGRVDMTQYHSVRINFDATPNAVTAWFKPDEFCRLTRIAQIAR